MGKDWNKSWTGVALALGVDAPEPWVERSGLGVILDLEHKPLEAPRWHREGIPLGVGNWGSNTGLGCLKEPTRGSAEDSTIPAGPAPGSAWQKVGGADMYRGEGVASVFP